MDRFLTAKWVDLIMVNYEIDPAVLSPRVPLGTDLDAHDGRYFVSVVAFMFMDTRVVDFLIPFHINFEEANLRFYVKRDVAGEHRRGVVFVKEVVPRFAVATLARLLYGEPYECWPMSNHRSASEVRYGWEKGSSKNFVSVRRGANIGQPPEGSHGEFITEHYWGYTRRGPHRTDEYRVEHPKWELFDALELNLSIDFERLYGRDLGFLSDTKPFSVLLAEGSEVAVYKGEKIV